MNTTKKIPDEVKVLFDKSFTIKYIGIWKGADAFEAFIPNAYTGFPFVCLVRNDSVEQITGFEALDIVTELVKE